MELNKEQLEAIKTVTKPLLVIAGAGTGKTTLITEKIRFLNEYLNIPPERILAITFTNKAAREMKKRVEQENKKFPFISTFHSFALKIIKSHLEEAQLNENFSIYDEKDQEFLIKEILKENNLLDVKLPIKHIINQISFAKENPEKPLDSKIKLILQKYQEALIENNAIDFSDIIITANNIFTENPEIKEIWKNSFDYIMVDEFQDTNKSQLKLIRHLYNQNYGNLTAVGDPNQCIYSWRGSDINNILEFPKQFPNTKIVKLKKNYRSTKKIVYIANKIIEKELPEKFIPKLKTENPEGIFPIIKVFKSDTEEAKKIAQTIMYLKEKQNSKFKEIAILVRNHSISSEIEKQLIKHNIPYEIHGKHTLAEKSEIKLLLSYLKLAINPQDEISFKYCINKPTRGIGEKTIENLKEHFEKDWITTLEKNNKLLNSKQKTEVEKFLKLIKFIKRKINNNEKDLTEIIKKTKIENYLIQKYKDKATVTKKLNNIWLLQSLIKESSESIKDFIENVSLQSHQDSIDDKKDKVKIITIHSAKGLEFQTVFIPAIEEGTLPSTLSDPKEEKRVFYTAVTRAKKFLFLSAVKYRKDYSQVVKPTKYSRFLKEVVKAIPQKTKV